MAALVTQGCSEIRWLATKVCLLINKTSHSMDLLKAFESWSSSPMFTCFSIDFLIVIDL